MSSSIQHYCLHWPGVPVGICGKTWTLLDVLSKTSQIAHSLPLSLLTFMSSTLSHIVSSCDYILFCSSKLKSVLFFLFGPSDIQQKKSSCSCIYFKLCNLKVVLFFCLVSLIKYVQFLSCINYSYRE